MKSFTLERPEPEGAIIRIVKPRIAARTARSRRLVPALCPRWRIGYQPVARPFSPPATRHAFFFQGADTTARVMRMLILQLAADVFRRRPIAPCLGHLDASSAPSGGHAHPRSPDALTISVCPRRLVGPPASPAVCRFPIQPCRPAVTHTSAADNLRRPGMPWSVTHRQSPSGEPMLSMPLVSDQQATVAMLQRRPRLSKSRARQRPSPDPRAVRPTRRCISSRPHTPPFCSAASPCSDLNGTYAQLVCTAGCRVCRAAVMARSTLHIAFAAAGIQQVSFNDPLVPLIAMRGEVHHLKPSTAARWAKGAVTRARGAVTRAGISRPRGRDRPRQPGGPTAGRCRRSCWPARQMSRSGPCETP